ncbi:MAG: gamma subclass chorismate mutase AroQ [Undibacterium sp.]|nr:gamma subclass chorismate mutase AroQ [Undibacterium sp.]
MDVSKQEHGYNGTLYSPHFQVFTPMRISFIVIAFCLGILQATSLSAQSKSQIEQIHSRGTLRVGTTGDYKPFSYRHNANSPWIGFDIEMAQNLATHLGVSLEWVPTSWPNLMRDLAAGNFDIVMSGVSISSERKQQAMFSLAYLEDGKTPITRCGEQAHFQTLAQIDDASVRVVVNPGGTNERFVREHLQRAQIIIYPDNNRIFDQIIDGHADLMITDAIEARLQQRLKPTLCALHPETPFNRVEKAYLLPQDAAWKALLDDWLQQKLRDGVVSTSMEKWLNHPWPNASPASIQFDELRELMAQRLTLMEDVARHKWNQQSEIEDVPREQKIILSLQKRASALGIPSAWAEHFFRAQIEAAKQVQRDYFLQWHNQQQAQFTQVPNLDTVIRPQLDQLTEKILHQLAMTWPALIDPHQHPRIKQHMQALQKQKWSELAVAMTIAPLIDGSAF